MLAIIAACGAPPPQRPSLDAIAEGYVRAALRLAQHQPDLVEGWRGPQEWRPHAREPVARTAAQIAELVATLDQRASAHTAGDEPDRLAYLRGQLIALDLAARRLLGQSRPFDEELRLAFGLRHVDTVVADTTAARALLATVLPGSGSVRDRHEGFRRQFVVPANRRQAVLDAALKACRDVTRTHLSLPDDEAVQLRLDVRSPWDGTARYEGDHHSTIEISGPGPLDISRALTLACHEAYPGHHVQHVLIDDVLVREKGWTELQLAPRFGPHVLIAEGAAEAGVDLAMPPDERLRLYTETLFPLAHVPVTSAGALIEVEERVRALDTTIPGIIGAYLDSRASRDDTVRSLGDAGVLDPDAFVAFAERRRTVAVVYPMGRRAIARALGTGGDPWGRLQALFTTSAFSLD